MRSRNAQRSIAWLTRDNRKVRYRDVITNDHWRHHRAGAHNLLPAPVIPRPDHPLRMGRGLNTRLARGRSRVENQGRREARSSFDYRYPDSRLHRHKTPGAALFSLARQSYVIQQSPTGSPSR